MHYASLRYSGALTSQVCSWKFARLLAMAHWLGQSGYWVNISTLLLFEELAPT